MLEFLANLRKILPLAKNSLLPALLLAICLIGFYANEYIPEVSMLTLHWLFYVLGILSIGTLIYFNQSKPVMFIVVMIICYISINFLKFSQDGEYTSSYLFINMSVLAPINLFFFYIVPQGKLFCKENVYILLGIFLQIAMVENLSATEISLGYNFISKNSGGINDLSLLLFSLGTIAILFITSLRERILSSYMMFAYIEIMFGFIYSYNPSALTIFFTSAIITLFCGLGYDIYYSTYKDVLTNLLSRNSYIIQSKNFPMKYSIGIISIDDYDRMTRIFKRYELEALIMMISGKIVQHEKENPVYRYDKDEFVIVFKNEGKNETFDKLENIRRSIAGTEFILSERKKPIKLTISASVSDKKRSDANSFEVLVRARKVLEKTNKFSQNVTTKA